MSVGLISSIRGPAAALRSNMQAYAEYSKGSGHRLRICHGKEARLEPCRLGASRNAASAAEGFSAAAQKPIMKPLPVIGEGKRLRNLARGARRYPATAGASTVRM